MYNIANENNNNLNTSYDKDIWRIGGSSLSNTITDKWVELNQMMIKYFLILIYFP